MKVIASTILFAAMLTGCATNPDNQFTKIQSDLDQTMEQNSQLQSTIDKSNAELQRLSELNRQLQVANTSSSSQVSTSQAAGSDLLPPNAKTGECYARVLIPAEYKTESSEVLKKAAAYRIKVTQPTYNWITEEVLVKEASEVAELVPARYEWRTETVLVKDAHEHIKTIPAVYETTSERVLVKAAYTTWKKGRGPIERLNNSTGEIMCLVEIPAEYRTITTKIIKTSARTEKESHPAVYKEIKKRVMVEGPTMVKRTIPAEYKTIKVKKVAQPAQETRIEIPAVYQTVTNRVKVSDSFLEWRSILCETNTTGNVVRNLQRALLAAGHNPGAIDGVIGRDTMQAVKSYQQEKGMSVGQLTIETIKSLGVSY